MSNASTAAPPQSPSQQPVKQPSGTSPLRLGILLGVLGVATLMTLHHYLMGQPSTQEAYDKIEEEFKKRNARGVSTANGKIDAGLLTPDDVSKLLQRSPWSRVEGPGELVEYYWWYGLPDRNYVSVKYIGKKGDWRLETFYLNTRPPKEDDIDANVSPPSETPKTTGAEGRSGPALPQPMDEAPGEPPATESPAADAPAGDAPTSDAPAAPADENN
jgi:hypothetical protein